MIATGCSKVSQCTCFDDKACLIHCMGPMQERGKNATWRLESERRPELSLVLASAKRTEISLVNTSKCRSFPSKRGYCPLELPTDKIFDKIKSLRCCLTSRVRDMESFEGK